MSRILKMIAAVLAVFIFSSSGEIAPYEPLDSDNLKLNFTVISDGHIEGNNSQKGIKITVRRFVIWQVPKK